MKPDSLVAAFTGSFGGLLKGLILQDESVSPGDNQSGSKIMGRGIKQWGDSFAVRLHRRIQDRTWGGKWLCSGNQMRSKTLEAHTVGAKNGNIKGWSVGRENLGKGSDWVRFMEP